MSVADWIADAKFTDWITAAVAVLALVLSAVALVYSRRATGAAVKSADASVRSADSSERSADASERSADAAARSASVDELAEQRAQQEAEDRTVRWEISTAAVNESPASLAHLEEAVRIARIGSPQSFWLVVTNVGEADAHDVRVLLAGEAPSIAKTLPPGKFIRRQVPWHATRQTVTVHWCNRPGGNVRTWIGRHQPSERK